MCGKTAGSTMIAGRRASELLPILILAPSAAALAIAFTAEFAFTCGCAVAAYHVGVQQGWWAEVGVCEASSSRPLTLTDLRSLAVARARPACNQVDWSLFGLSLAAFNLIFSAGLAIFFGIMARWRFPFCVPVSGCCETRWNRHPRSLAERCAAPKEDCLA
jgi:disulfide bond formation protein DsbB